MARQIVSLYRVLPPFEVVSYPKSIDVVTKTPAGDELVVTIPVNIFANEQEYINEASESIAKIQDGMILEKATNVILVTAEQINDLKSGVLKVKDIDTIEDTQ